MSSQIHDRILRFALPLAAGLCVAAVAILHRDRSVGAEAAFLALVAAAVLLSVAQLVPRIRTVFCSFVILVVTCVWALPGTADRGATLSLLLVAGLLTGALLRSRDQSAFRSLAPNLALFLGAQFLFRCRDLLDLSLAGVLGLVTFPLLAAASTLVLTRVHGRLAAYLAAAIVSLVEQGFGTVGTLSLVAAAAAGLAFEKGLCARRGWKLLAPSAAVASMLLAAALRGSGSPSQALAGFALVPLLLPFLILKPREALLLKLAASALVLAVLLAGLDRSVLSAPLAFLALSARDLRSPVATLQGWWTGALWTGSLLAASYPWLRADSLKTTLQLLGLNIDWPSAAIVTAVTAAAAWLAGSVLRWQPRVERFASILACSLIVLGLVVSLPLVSRVPIRERPIELKEDDRSWHVRLPTPTPARSIVLDSALAHSSSLAIGTPVARIRVRGPALAQDWEVRAGIDSGEWAAHRADVAGRPGFAAPKPFLSWVDASSDFFGQRYRSQWTLPAEATVDEIEIRLERSTPGELALTLFHLELRR